MKKELELKLQKKYPKIFQDLYGDKRKTGMARGVGCNDGWYNIIDGLCRGIQNRCDSGKCPQVVAAQIKEKFGGLRFYYDGGDEFVSSLVSSAEHLSYKTCEVCGNVGEVRDGGWIKTLCDIHANGKKKLSNQSNYES